MISRPSTIQPDTLSYRFYLQNQNKNILKQNGTIPYSLKNEIPYSLEKGTPYSLKNEIPYSLEKGVPYSLEKGVPYSLEKGVPYSLEKGVPYSLEKGVPYSLEKGVPYSLENEIPYSLERGTRYSGEKENSAGFQEISALNRLGNKIPGVEINLAEKRMIEQLKGIDAEVRAHEQAHLAAAGGVATSGPHYIYLRGPDGRLYAVGGEVSINSGPVPGNPEKTILKAQKMRRAALAPANPSGQDMQVAAAATRMEQQARAELAGEKTESKNGQTGPAQSEFNKGDNPVKENSGLYKTLTEFLEEAGDEKTGESGVDNTLVKADNKEGARLFVKIKDMYSEKAAGISEESKQLIDLFV